MLRHQNGFGSSRKSCVKSDIAAMASHDFDNVGASMRVRRIAELANRFNHRLHRRMKTNRVIGITQIVINGARNAHRANATLMQLCSTLK